MATETGECLAESTSGSGDSASTTTTVAEAPAVTATITSPADGDSVAYPITLTAQLGGEPGDLDVFAVVRQERGGAYKLVDSCDISGGIDVRCNELYLGAGEAHGIGFDLLLVTADDNAQQAFDEAGPPGRNELPAGIQILDRVTVTRE